MFKKATKRYTKPFSTVQVSRYTFHCNNQQAHKDLESAELRGGVRKFGGDASGKAAFCDNSGHASVNMLLLAPYGGYLFGV